MSVDSTAVDDRQLLTFECLNYHLRQAILSYLTLKELGNALLVSRRFKNDVKSVLAIHIRTLSHMDLLPIPQESQFSFFQQFQPRLLELSLYCPLLSQELILAATQNASLISLNLIAAPISWWTNSSSKIIRQLPNKLKHTLKTLKISILQSSVILCNTRQINKVSGIAKPHGQQSQPVLQSASFQPVDGNPQQGDQQDSSSPSECLNTFWQQFECLENLTVKEIIASPNISSEHTFFLNSILQANKHLSITNLYLQNLVLGESQQSTQNHIDQQNQNEQSIFLQPSSWKYLRNIKIENTRQSPRVLAISDHTLGCLIRIFPSSVKEISLKDKSQLLSAFHGSEDQLSNSMKNSFFRHFNQLEQFNIVEQSHGKGRGITNRNELEGQQENTNISSKNKLNLFGIKTNIKIELLLNQYYCSSSKLTQLSLVECAVSAESLVEIILSYKQLTKLQVNRVDKLHPDFSFKFLQQTAYSTSSNSLAPPSTSFQLQHLDLSYNSSLCSNDITHLFNLFPKLQTLSLLNCSIDSLNPFVFPRSTLNKLNLANNPIFITSEKSFQEFAQTLLLLHSLQHLTIEIPNIDRLLRHTQINASHKPLLIHESFNQCTYALFNQ